MCSDQTYAESLNLSPAIPQLDGHDDSNILNPSETNEVDFSDIIKNQEEEQRRNAEKARLEKEADLENFRKLINQSFL